MVQLNCLSRGGLYPAVIYVGLESGKVLPFGGFQDLCGPALPVSSETHTNLLQRIQHGRPAKAPTLSAGEHTRRPQGVKWLEYLS